ncbi:MAG: peptidoglycan editing factor PgeF [Candidatus Caldatribacteriaceae bacterium]
MKEVTIRGVPFLQFETVLPPSFLHVFTLKGVFFRPHESEEEKRLQQVLAIDHCSFPSQVHGRRWLVVDKPLHERPLADALLTSQKGVYLGILVADCLPVLFVDVQNEALAVAHAGWRGVALGIHLEVLRAMENVFGSRPQELFVGIGPAIGPCCFEVKEEVSELFARRDGRRVQEKEGRFFVDLAGVVEDELVERGIERKNLEVSGLCTMCHEELFHSFRREKEATGRHALLAGWRKRD